MIKETAMRQFSQAMNGGERKASQVEDDQLLKEWEKNYAYLLIKPEVMRDQERATMVISFARHGQKAFDVGGNMETPLTDRGYLHSALNVVKRSFLGRTKKSESIEEDRVDSYRVAHSPIERTQLGAEIAKYLPKGWKYNVKPTEDTRLGYQQFMSQDYKKQMGSKKS